MRIAHPLAHRHSDSVVLTARAPQGLVGFAIMRYLEDTAHLNLLAVLPAHRRRGVARALLRWLEETALTAGTYLTRSRCAPATSARAASTAASATRNSAAIPGYYQGMEAAIRMRARPAPAAVTPRA